MSDRIGVELSDDALEARLTIGAGDAADIASLTAALAKAKVTAGIDRALSVTIGEALADPSYTLQEVIARGSPAEPGIDGEILMAVGDELQAGQARADGSLDYRDRHSLTTVSSEDRLATILEPTKAQAGITVTGKKLPARDGVAASIALGPGVERQDQELLATRDGVLSYFPGKRIDVVRLVEHKADVDYASGNLDVEGSVIVSGDIQPEFTVVASDDVIINGSVDDGTVFAGNSIRIAGGAMGKGTELVAESEVHCRHAREARLCASGTITLGDHSVNSHLAAENVYAVTGRGAVVGGEIHAQRLISLREAGSAAGTKTILAVAITTAEIATLMRPPQDPRGDPQGHDSKQRARSHEGDSLSLKETDRIADEQRISIQEKKLLLAQARIEISGTAHPGVSIRFAEHELSIKDPLPAPVFVFDPQSKSIINRS